MSTVNGRLIEFLGKGGLLLGVMKGMPYERGTVHLDPGDVVVMFTDGVTEAMGPDGEEYTDARLQACLATHHHEPAQALTDKIQADVEAFTGPVAVRSDDRTMIVLKVTGCGLWVSSLGLGRCCSVRGLVPGFGDV